jgi:hypothetical protein
LGKHADGTIRYVQVGESAGSSISLPAAVLRSTAITIMGTAGIPSREILAEAMRQVMTHAASGELQIDTKPVLLADIENAWQEDHYGSDRSRSIDGLTSLLRSQIMLPDNNVRQKDHPKTLAT